MIKKIVYGFIAALISSVAFSAVPGRITLDITAEDMCPDPIICPICETCEVCPEPVVCPEPIVCPICPELPVNQLPIADAGLDQTVILPTGQANIRVRLDATLSYDPDGKYFGYLWEGTPKPLANMRPYVTLAEGTYTFTLVIEDADGAMSEPDSVTITVVPEVPLFVGPTQTPNADDLAYLVDTGLPYPRITTGAASTPSSSDGKYDSYLIKDINGMSHHANFMNSNPDSLFIRWISPHAYQAYGASNPYLTGFGMAFATTGPITDGNGQVYAGHWRYYAGTKTSTNLTVDGTTVSVQSLKQIKVGDYIVIYDSPYGSFNNAEHTEVVGIVGNTLELKRGFKSTAVDHPTGSIIAEHHLGQGTNPLLWGWHHGINCPRDGNGKQLSEVMSSWMIANINIDGDGSPIGAEFDGLIFDADFGSMRSSGALGFSSYNNGVADDGYDPVTGENLWGQGYDRFYSLLRQGFGPDFLIVGGAKSTGGYDILSGNQFEAFPGSGSAGDAILAIDDSEINSYPSSIVSHSSGYNSVSQYSEVPNKHCTSVSPKDFEVEEPRCLDSNITMPPWRLRFASVTIMGMYFGDQWRNRGPEPWYDEYSVDITTGKADTLTDIKNGQVHRNWLGLPIGPAQRISPVGDLLYSESFDVDPGRIDKNVISEVSNGTLKIGKFITPTADWTGTTVRLMSDVLVPAGSIMVSFKARSDAPNWMRVSVNNVGQMQLVDQQWRRFVTTFDISNSGNKTVGFDVGRLTQYPIEIDDINIYQGDPNLFYRRYENGILVANFTDSVQAVNLGEPVKRILGTQDPTVNNGEEYLDGIVNVPPGDAAVLIRIK